MKCCVRRCKNFSDKKWEHNQHISFHRFPSDDALKESWRKAITSDPKWFPTKVTRVCSIHFDENVFYRTRVGIKKIRLGAIPTLNLPKTEPESVEIKKENEDKDKENFVSKFLIDNDTPQTKVLKYEIYRLKIREKKLDLKVRKLQMSKSRLNKKVISLTHIIEDLEKRNLLLEELVRSKENR